MVDSVLDSGLLLGSSEVLEQALWKLGEAAKTGRTVLLVGEPGTGKEGFARRYHQATGRDGKFVAVNCRGLNASLVFDLLFGHEKGAFTGANSLKQGLFELSDGGTLFLDEIAHLPAEALGALIRFLEGGRFSRVGGHVEMRSDVRVIAATNVSLEHLVRQNRFPQDIYDRVAQVVIEVPPLRERGRDVAIIFDHYWSVTSGSVKRELRVSREARRLLLSQRWPGNIRQMQNVIADLFASVRGRRVEVGEVCACLRIEDEEVPVDAEARLEAQLAEAPRSSAELAHDLGVSPTWVSRRLRERRADGRVEEIRRGRRRLYSLRSEAATAEPAVSAVQRSLVRADAAAEHRLEVGSPDHGRTVDERRTEQPVLNAGMDTRARLLELTSDGIARSPGELLWAVGAQTSAGRRTLYKLCSEGILEAFGNTRRRRYILAGRGAAAQVDVITRSESMILASLTAMGPASPTQLARALEMEPWRVRRFLYRLKATGVSAMGNTRQRRYFPPVGTSSPRPPPASGASP